MAKEERQISKIRELIKERNKIRAQRQRKMPAPKRRKLNETQFEPRQDKEQEDVNTRGGEEKRKLEDPAEAPPAKRRANKDNREMLGKNKDQNMTTPQEHEQAQDARGGHKDRQEQTPPTPTVHYGLEMHGQEIVNWEEKYTLKKQEDFRNKEKTRWKELRRWRKAGSFY